MSQVIRLDELDTEAAVEVLGNLEKEAARILAAVGVGKDAIDFQVELEMRYVGQGFEIPVPITQDILRAGAESVKATFDAEYERVFGRAVADVAAELLTWRVRGRGPSPVADWDLGTRGTSDAAGARKGTRPAYFDDPARVLETPVFDRYQLGSGAVLSGPAIVEEQESTAVVPPRAQASIDGHHNLVIELPT
jgi:N-methylhydantoinase A